MNALLKNFLADGITGQFVFVKDYEAKDVTTTGGSKCGGRFSMDIAHPKKFKKGDIVTATTYFNENCKSIVYNKYDITEAVKPYDDGERAYNGLERNEKIGGMQSINTPSTNTPNYQFTQDYYIEEKGTPQKPYMPQVIPDFALRPDAPKWVKDGFSSVNNNGASDMRYKPSRAFKKGDKVFANVPIGGNKIFIDGYEVPLDVVKYIGDDKQENKAPNEAKLSIPVVALLAIGVGLLLYAFKGE